MRLSKQIGQAKAQKDEAKAAQLMDQVAHLKDAIQQGEDERRRPMRSCGKRCW